MCWGKVYDNPAVLHLTPLFLRLLIDPPFFKYIATHTPPPIHSLAFHAEMLLAVVSGCMTKCRTE